MSDATPKSSDAKPAFDMSSIGAALADITNGKLGSKPDSKNKDDGASKDKEAWVPREAYDYRVYNAQTREERELLEADEKLVLPDWAANAQKYEWSDEYGDIGPEHPDLEKQLFGGDFLVRRGQELEKWVPLQCTSSRTMVVRLTSSSLPGLRASVSLRRARPASRRS